MKCYFFSIQEIATYFQEGTVYVIAESEEEAKEKCLAGKYIHTGDNMIDWDSEANTIVSSAKLHAITDCTEEEHNDYTTAFPPKNNHDNNK